MITTHARLRFVLALGMLALAAPAFAQDGAAGTYVTNVGGVKIELVLRPDGTATAAGQSARWSQRGQAITLVDAAGVVEHGTLAGRRLTMQVEGAEIVFERSAPPEPERRPGAPAQPPAGSKSGCGDKLVPARLLEGVKTSIPNTNVSLRLPKGWTGVWMAGQNGGPPSYRVTAPPAGPEGFVVLVLTLLPEADRSKSMDALLREAAANLAPADTADAVESRRFAVGANCGGRTLLRVGGHESNVTVIRAGDWLYVAVARYPEASANVMRAGIETMVATAELGAPPPPADSGVAKQLLGCWERFEGSSSGSGYGSTGATLRLAGDGSYSWRRYGYVSVPGAGSMMNDDTERGRYQADANELRTTPNQGDPATYAIALSKGRLLLGRSTYIPCR